MLVADDELLALILRFVALDKKKDTTHEVFMRQQVQAMQQYIQGFPEEQQAERAMEWVQERAVQYRHNWQNREAERRGFGARCKDCPLRWRGIQKHCEIHEQWVYLLQCYITGSLTSKDYVEQVLGLLKTQKKQLKHRLSDPSRTWKGKKKRKKAKASASGTPCSP